MPLDLKVFDSSLAIPSINRKEKNIPRFEETKYILQMSLTIKYCGSQCSLLSNFSIYLLTYTLGLLMLLALLLVLPSHCII
jgi:hypothetical protein